MIRYEIGVAYFAMNPPKPSSLDVVKIEEGKPSQFVAWLEYEQVKRALERYENMMEVWKKGRGGPEENHDS